MIKKVEIFLYNRLLERSFINDHEKYLFLISLAACIYAVTMHVFLLCFYLVLGILPLFTLYFTGFLIDILLFWLVRKRHYPLFGVLLSASVMVHTVLSAISIGINNLVIMYPLVTLMMQIIIPYARMRIRSVVIFILWVCMIALVFIDHNMVPIWDIGEANTVLAVFNIQLAFLAILIQLTIGNTIMNTIMKANHKELEKSKDQANMDSLTGLFNRRYATMFFERLSKEQDEQTWCVAMLDIDDFKLVNDTHGHQVGDGVLISLGNIIKTNLRKTDVIFRWGGEEFLILLKDVDVPIAFQTLDKLRRKIAEETLETHGKTIKITVTIGVCPLDAHNVEQSVHMSDLLMYKGKASGKNTVIM